MWFTYNIEMDLCDSQATVNTMQLAKAKLKDMPNSSLTSINSFGMPVFMHNSDDSRNTQHMSTKGDFN